MQMRKWQAEAAEMFQEKGSSDFLLVAFPGTGKTRAALNIARETIGGNKRSRLIVVAPTTPVQGQWVQEAQAFGFPLSSEFSARSVRRSTLRDTKGLSVTYQSVSRTPRDFADIAEYYDTFVILDEAHHLSEDMSWGQAAYEAFADARWRLSLSGTPFRTDRTLIPWINYRDGEALADFRYRYGEAFDDKCVRRIYFPSIDADAEWEEKVEGLWTTRSVRLSDSGSGEREDVKATDASRALYTAVKDEDYQRAVLRQAHTDLLSRRRCSPNAAGIVTVIDRNHADRVADILQDITHSRPLVVDYQDRHAPNKLRDFRDASSEWLVSIKMASEGYDAARLQVGVYLTNVATRLYFAQFAGRVIRGPGEASVYMPKHPLLKQYAQEFLDEIAEAIRRKEAAKDAGDIQETEREVVFRRGDATADDSEVYVDGTTIPREEWDVVTTIKHDMLRKYGENIPEVLIHEIKFGEIQDVTTARTFDETRHAVVREINKLAARVVHKRQLDREHGYREVHYEFNSRVGIRSHDKAELADLEKKRDLIREELTN